MGDREATRPPRYVEAVARALGDELAADDDVVVLGVDVGAAGGAYGATRGLHERFGPARVIDTPIAEAGVLGAAVGAAMAGLRPVVEIMYMDFLTVCLDPIVNQAAKLPYMTAGGVRMPIVFRTQTGGGRSSGAQHSQSLEAVLAHVPGLKVFLPGDARDAYDLLRAAVRDDGPVVVVENRRLYNRRAEDFDSRAPLPPGRARIVRAGTAATVVAWGRMVDEVVRACADDGPLAGVDLELVDLRTLVPLDLETVVQSVLKTGRALVVHEAVTAFGPGAEIAARIDERLRYDVEGPIRRLGALASPVPYAPQLEAAVLPDADGIAAAVRALLEG
ncbi:transketolase C-terminal domain-containing protein [Conexibacter stalactiti]|uniref:Transketolase C-terminal domain-containing protein n=1 Tax=Conexibacter stalactiti TaxID=1940611 RepID=A0ABU4HT90_9ACTN|nr:transketolase C-terminal domain-containing protein [Conexibacter stalactiti]MDW5596538.1 transketolase C-terminal domain-containing protein [Conexibacter stalactiti]MEC5037180.1 transketolase C-terminal domain-containing protein [Conexibacter stalactiti]